MTSFKLLILVCVIWGSSGDPGCVNVVPAEDYVNSAYEGRWYEIGKTQTAGGGSWQRGCWCDTTDFTSPYPDLGNGQATYTCRHNSPDGFATSATGDLIYYGVPGNFIQTFSYEGSPSVDYNIIYIDEDASVEYDCYTDDLGITNYCVHYMSRTPTMDPAKLDVLTQYAEGLGLNNQNINFTYSKQEGCW